MFSVCCSTIKSIANSMPDDIAGKSVLCAVSAGPDSMLLLHILHVMAADYGFAVQAAHVNHGLRGNEAEADEMLVRDYCSQYGIVCSVAHYNVLKMAKAEKISVETAGRQARRDFLEKTARQQSCAYIAVAHHADDQAETMLMHLARGSGLKGLGGMKVLNGIWWRPLLSLSKQDILNGVQSLDIPFRLDQSNFESDYTRNRYRMMIQEWKKEQPTLVEQMTKAAELLQRDEGCLQEWAEREAKTCVLKSSVLDAKRLAELPRSISSRILRMELAKCGVYQDVARVHIDTILAGCQQGENKQWSLPDGKRAVLDDQRLYIQTEPDSPVDQHPMAEYPIVMEGKTETPWGSFCCEVCTLMTMDKQNPWMAFLPEAWMEGAVIRMRRPGDWMRPYGMQGRKKIKDILIDKKIPKGERNGPMLVHQDHEVLWAVGHAYSQTCADYFAVEKGGGVKLSFYPFGLNEPK